MKIQVIVTCASSKTLPTPPQLKFSNLPKLPLQESLKEWNSRLSSTPSPTTSILDLYKGGYWKVVKSLISNKKVDNIWVLSAGYGIVNYKEKVKPYSIALKDNSFDSIKLNTINSNSFNPYSQWWDEITKMNHRTISQVYSENPGDLFILYSSFEYMKAIKNDFGKIISNPNVLVISPDTKIKEFDPYILKTNLRLQSLLGGNKMNISSLTLKHLIDNIDIIGTSRDDINQYFTHLISTLPPLPPRNPTRKKLNDEDFIKVLIKIGINKSKTQIIKEVNELGFASGVNRTTRILNTLRNKTQNKI